MGKKTVLLVDDDFEVLDILDLVLSDKYQILKASSGKKCLDTLKNKHVDLVLLDVMMPIMDGVETLEEIRKINSFVPIIIHTAVPAEQLLAKLLLLGASDYLDISVDSNKLIERIEIQLSDNPWKKYEIVVTEYRDYFSEKERSLEDENSFFSKMSENLSYSKEKVR